MIIDKYFFERSPLHFMNVYNHEFNEWMLPRPYSGTREEYHHVRHCKFNYKIQIKNSNSPVNVNSTITNIGHSL